MTTITPQELLKRREAGENVRLVDVRTPVEYREIHVEFAENLPLDRLEPERLTAEHNGEGPLYVICRSGSRASMACDKLRAAGHPHVVNVEGGTLACEAAGLPVKRGRKAISLDRQVRIAAGSLVLAGALLSIVNPYFIILSGFVGAGLVFAGITDTCGMGMLLAKMPWNQVGSAPCAAGNQPAKEGASCKASAA